LFSEWNHAGWYWRDSKLWWPGRSWSDGRQVHGAGWTDLLNEGACGFVECFQSFTHSLSLLCYVGLGWCYENPFVILLHIPRYKARFCLVRSLRSQANNFSHNI
jgi:hypothetical protein